MKESHFGMATLAIVALFATVSSARRYDRERTVQCESQSGRYTYCRTLTSRVRWALPRKGLFSPILSHCTESLVRYLDLAVF